MYIVGGPTVTEEYVTVIPSALIRALDIIEVKETLLKL